MKLTQLDYQILTVVYEMLIADQQRVCEAAEQTLTNSDTLTDLAANGSQRMTKAENLDKLQQRLTAIQTAAGFDIDDIEALETLADTAYLAAEASGFNLAYELLRWASEGAEN